jgi:hypothetical protein
MQQMVEQASEKQRNGVNVGRTESYQKALNNNQLFI